MPDPSKDRIVTGLDPPPQHPISHSFLFPPGKKRGTMEIPDWITLKEHLLKEGKLSKQDLLQLIISVTEIMSKIF